MSFYLPLAIVVVSNTVYQICCKSVPDGMDPFASLTVTYLIAALASGAALLLTHRGGVAQEYAKLNWAPIVLGVVIVGLEVGFIFAYQAGWQVSTLSVTQGALLAVTLLVVGALAYHEPITLKKLAGVAACIGGLVLLNT